MVTTHWATRAREAMRYPDEARLYADLVDDEIAETRVGAARHLRMSAGDLIERRATIVVVVDAFLGEWLAACRLFLDERGVAQIGGLVTPRAAAMSAPLAVAAAILRAQALGAARVETETRLYPCGAVVGAHGEAMREDRAMRGLFVGGFGFRTERIVETSLVGDDQDAHLFATAGPCGRIRVRALRSTRRTTPAACALVERAMLAA